MLQTRLKMAASIRRVQLLIRSNFFQHILYRTLPAVSVNSSHSAKSLSLSLSARSNYSTTSEAVRSLHLFRNVRFQSSAQITDYVCWNCNHVHSSYAFVCEKCRTLQEPKEGSTHFDVMGISQSFRIDTSSLTKKFRELQRIFHPDKFTNKSKKEKELSEHHSSAVNKAYSTLLKPIPRGHYLLELHGYSLEEGEIELDPDFLMEIMEINEAIFHANELETVREIDEKNKIVLDKLIAQVAKHFDQGDIPSAKETLARLNYYTNIDDKVKEIERQYMDHSTNRSNIE